MFEEIFSSGNFTSLDWCIVTVYVGLSIVVGLVANKLIGGLAHYIIAGRSLGTALSIATMTGTELGLVTVMYSAQKGFTGGFAAFHIAVMACIVTFFVGLTGFIVVPLRETGVMTIPEYYERRFGRRTRILGGILLAFGGILNMGLFLKIGSQFLVGATGIDPSGGFLALVMTVLITLVLIYTILGGMVSVVIMDYIQFVVISTGLILLVCLISSKFGWSHMVDVVWQAKGESGFDPTLKGSGFGPSYIAWQGVLGLVSCAIWPTAVTRALAARNTQVVRRQYMFSSLSFLIRFLIPYFLGIGAFVYVMTSGEMFREAFFPSDGSEGLSNLYAMPLFVSHLLPTGLLGIVTASMIAAFMSTHDSYLLCWSSVITLDIVAPLRQKRPLTDKTKIVITRVTMVLIGIYILLWGLWYEGSDDIWEYMGITGAIYSTGAISVLAFGLYWKRASSTGAVLALVAGFSAILGLGKVREALHYEVLEKIIGFELTAPVVGLMALALTLTVMVVGSLLWPDRSSGKIKVREVK
ncbi:MAG: sodium:solute symporter family protein [bacterium]